MSRDRTENAVAKPFVCAPPVNIFVAKQEYNLESVRSERIVAKRDIDRKSFPCLSGGVGYGAREGNRLAV